MERLVDKGPAEILDYPIDWTDWLSSGAAIDSAVTVLDGTSTPAGDTSLTVDSTVVSNPNSVIWLSGGTANNEYTLKLTVTDDQSPERTAVRRFKIKIQTK